MTARLRRQDWLLAGLAVVRDDGDAALTLERLCAVVEKTKGSFYHHFGDVDGFAAELLTTWEHELTTLPIAEGTTAARLDDVVRGLDHRLDRAVRAWGLRDARARAAVDRVDGRRIAHLERLHVDAKTPSPKTAAQLEYAVFLGLQHCDVLGPSTARSLRPVLQAAIAATTTKQTKKTKAR